MTATISKLLIVDDLPENLQALDALIRGDDRAVHQARTGDEALSLLLEHEFALAIVDIQMPGMSGFELAELMRGTDRTRHIPIVFVSAAGKERDYVFKGYEAGAVDFLHKPLDPDVVKSKVNVFVALHRQRIEARERLQALEESRQEQENLLSELHAMQAQLERAVQMRDHFMSMVAHELRTPLNTLYLEAQVRSLQLGQGKLIAFGPERLRAMVDRDTRQIQSMVRLVDDMLDVSRLRSGRLSIRPQEVELGALLARVVADLGLQASAAGSAISLHAPRPAHGHWDEFRVEQVVVNLLTNALRYGAGKPVQVRLDVDGALARIDVVDHGIGIAEHAQSRIFDAFECLDETGVGGGLGLGLYIARQLVQAHGGRIGVRSKPDEGSTFWVTLPLRPPEAATP